MSEQKNDVPIEIEARRTKVMALYSKGITQEEIAKELEVDQATVSRDLQEMRKVVTQQVIDEALFEFSRWMTGLDQMARAAWKMAENDNAPTVSKMKALEFLRDCYNLRLQILIGSHKKGKNAQDHVEAMKWGRHAYGPGLSFRREEN